MNFEVPSPSHSEIAEGCLMLWAKFARGFTVSMKKNNHSKESLISYSAPSTPKKAYP